MAYYYDTYRDQLASLDLGHALWDPDPAGLYDKVRVGDVGFMRKGRFLCMFNVFLPGDHSTQVYGVPEGFVPLFFFFFLFFFNFIYIPGHVSKTKTGRPKPLEQGGGQSWGFGVC